LSRSRHLPRVFREPPQLATDATVSAVRPRHALLINPFYAKDEHASFGKHVLTPTLALTSVAAATPRNWTVEIFDENLLQGPPPCDPVPQVVGISVHLTFAQRAYELARFYRARGAKVIFGGLHVTACPDECAAHADAIVVGEGSQVWGQALLDAERGRLAPRYEGSYRMPFRLDPAPRRALLPRDQFLTTASLIATRGCHNRCGFCYLATDGLDIPYMTRDVQQVVTEIRRERQPYAVFVDNNLGSRKEYLRALCTALAPLEIIWSAAVSIDVSDDPSLVRAMALAGCTGVFIGFESLSAGALIEAGKRTPLPEHYAARVRVFHDHGIQVNGSFVLGFDDDDATIFDRTCEWIEANRLECATFHILTPYPGTPLFRRMEAQGRILHRDWSKFDTAHVVFRPLRMSVEELADGYARCYERMFSLRSIVRRRPDDPRAVLPYFAMSLLYKRSNPLWRFLIERRLTARVWRPLVEITRKRHLAFRKRLAAGGGAGSRAASVVSAGV
jgi:radical SAM superfamily enzyme YgiQ (UPF0313 family)